MSLVPPFFIIDKRNKKNKIFHLTFENIVYLRHICHLRLGHGPKLLCQAKFVPPHTVEIM